MFKARVRDHIEPKDEAIELRWDGSFSGPEDTIALLELAAFDGPPLGGGLGDQWHGKDLLTKPLPAYLLLQSLWDVVDIVEGSVPFPESVKNRVY